MAELYNFTEYPMIYIIDQIWTMHGKNIKKKEIKSKIYSEYCLFLNYLIEKDDDLKYLDYELKIDKLAECIEIRPENIVAALWFINIFPIDCDFVYKNNKCVSDDGITYTFDNRTKKLKWIKDK